MSARVAFGKERFGVALSLVGAGLATLAWGASDQPREATFAWLVVFVFWTSVVLGAIALLLVGHATGARWFVALRRPLEGVASTVPALALLFLPIAAGLGRLYPACNPAWLEAHAGALSAGKRAWLSPAPVLVRSLLYLGLWWITSLALLEGSRASGREAVRFRKRTRTLASALLPVFALSTIFAAQDWVMALEPEWSSTIFGVNFLCHAFRSGVALAIVLAWVWRQRGLLPTTVGADHFSALGRLLLTSVIVVAYTEVAQGLLIWIADIPREVTYFVARAQGSWGIVLTFLIFVEVAVPFFALLLRSTKRDPGRLAAVAGLLIASEVIHAYWLVAPVCHALGPAPGILEAASLVASSSILAVALAIAQRGAPALPEGDPDLPASLRYRYA